MKNKTNACANLRHQWERFGMGDHLTDEELEAMLKQLNAAMPYLISRGTEFILVTSETIRNRNIIEGNLIARGIALSKKKGVGGL